MALTGLDVRLFYYDPVLLTEPSHTCTHHAQQPWYEPSLFAGCFVPETSLASYDLSSIGPFIVKQQLQQQGNFITSHASVPIKDGPYIEKHVMQVAIN